MPRGAFGIAALLVLAACGGPSPSPAGPAESTDPTVSAGGASAVPGVGAWEPLEAAPFERIEVAAAAHDGAIWLAGGLNADGSATAETWRFDPTAGEWTPGPALPEPLHHAALVSTGADLVLVGGYRGASFSTPVDTVLRLAPAGDAWEAGVPLPEGRAAGAAAHDGTRVVYAGGVTPAGEVSRAVLAFDGERWSQLGEMAAPREHLSAASDGDGRVWLLGGRTLSLGSSVGTVEYVEDALVTRIGELPTARGGAVAFHVPGIGACLAGGEIPSAALQVVECIGPDLEVVTLPPLAERRHGHSAAVVDGVVYVLLGGPEPLLTVSGTVERLRLAQP